MKQRQGKYLSFITRNEISLRRHFDSLCSGFIIHSMGGWDRLELVLRLVYFQTPGSKLHNAHSYIWKTKLEQIPGHVANH